MNPRQFWAHLVAVILVSALLVPFLLLLAGCTTTGPSKRSMMVMPPDEVVRELTRDLCKRGWKAVSYDSKLDTPLTVKEIRAANRARAAYCKDK